MWMISYKSLKIVIKVEALTSHLNGIDKTHTWARGEWLNPFLETIITRRDDGTIKLLIYTHRSRSVPVFSHHIILFGLNWLELVSTLLDRTNSIITLLSLIGGRDRRKDEEARQLIYRVKDLMMNSMARKKLERSTASNTKHRINREEWWLSRHMSTDSLRKYNWTLLAKHRGVKVARTQTTVRRVL